MNNNIKRLLPNNISSSYYILNKAKELLKNKNGNLSSKSLNESSIKNNLLIFEGKAFDPTHFKTIKKLKKDEKHLINELSKINSNEKLLKSKSYLNLFNNNPYNIMNDQKKINEKIKNLEKDKIVYRDKLSEVKARINTLQYNQEKELGILENSKKMKYDKFIEEYNNKNTIFLINKKIKKLRDESEKMQLLMKSDLLKQIDKKNSEINNKEKEEVLKKEALLKKIHEEEKENIEKRKKKNTEILLKIKEIKKEPKNKLYLYQKQEKKFLNNEKNLVKLENNKRKVLMKHINSDEFIEMRKNYEQISSKKKLESKLKIENIKKSWVARKKLVPLYINPLSKLVTEEDNKSKQEEKNKILKIKSLKNIQKNYSKDKIPKPIKKITDKIIKNENKNFHLNKPYFVKSNSYSNLLKQNAVIEYKKKIKNNMIDKNNSSEKDNLSLRFGSENIRQNGGKKKVMDYLEERRKIKFNKERRKSFSGLSNSDYTSCIDIKNLIKNKGMNENTFKIAKLKLDSLEEKAKQKNLLLKYSGGISNKPELGNEVCDLMIDSIQAKLSLIKEFDKNSDNSSRDENQSKSDKDDNNGPKPDQSNIEEKTDENIDDE